VCTSASERPVKARPLDRLELLHQVDVLAVELAATGVSGGDRVVTWVPSGWRAPVYLFALWKLGAIVVPFDREMKCVMQPFGSPVVPEVYEIIARFSAGMFQCQARSRRWRLRSDSTTQASCWCAVQT
jgi:acyl-CoA synthetase (AMP-forming)/AMP-acid ligase II